MFQFESDEIRHDLGEIKSLAVNLSRGLDRLAGKRQSRGEEPSAAQKLIAAIARQVQAHVSGGDRRGLSGGVDRWREVKAVASPAMTTTTGYAAEFAQPANSGIFDLLTPLSAYAQLSLRGMKVSLEPARCGCRCARAAMTWLRPDGLAGLRRAGSARAGSRRSAFTAVCTGAPALCAFSGSFIAPTIMATLRTLRRRPGSRRWPPGRRRSGRRWNQ